MTKEPQIIGWAHSKFGKSDAPITELVRDVSVRALEDAGMETSQIDAVHVGVFNNGLSPQGFEGTLPGLVIPELAFKPFFRHESACATGSAAVYAAYDSVASGRFDSVLVVGAEKMTHADGATLNNVLLSASYRPEEEGYGSFAGVFGHIASIYAEQYGDPLETLAQIAAKNHHNGAANPLAHMQKDLGFGFCNTVSEKNPEVASPLRRTDCSLVSDGAAALVISRTSNGRVRFRGMGHASDSLPLSKRNPLEFRGAKHAMNQALEAAGMNLTDADLLETHDCFTIAELLQYEAFGLAQPGQGHTAIESGLVSVNGDFPVNASGGLKAKGHPIGATGVSMHVTACMQVTNSFPGYQVKDATTAAVFNMGGAAVSNFASIVERV